MHQTPSSCSRNVPVNRGGKGILIGYDATFTLATENCDHICYEEPVTKSETGGGTQERRCGAFMGGQGPKARTIAYSEKISPSLKSAPSGGNTIPDVVYPINTMVAVRGGRDDMRTCFGVGEPGDPQFTISAAHCHAVAYKSPPQTASSRIPDTDGGRKQIYAKRSEHPAEEIR